MSKEKPKKINYGDALEHVKLSKSQEQFYEKIRNNAITFGTGPAGTSKTFTSCFAALALLNDEEVNKIIIVKPIQESGEKLGFLPGDVDDKLGPYMESYFHTFRKIISNEALTILLEHKTIESKALAYMRGATFDNVCLILDESQNCDFRQLMLLVTRLGQNSKMIITGDVTQYDIAYNMVALPDFINMISGVKGIDHHVFQKEDIVRRKLLIDITDRYDKWKNDELQRKNK